MTIGVPSAAAAPQLLVAQPIGPNDSIGSDSYIVLPPNIWANGTNQMPTFDNAVFVKIFLDGLVKKPATA